jgi:hypothetical protein
MKTENEFFSAANCVTAKHNSQILENSHKNYESTVHKITYMKVPKILLWYVLFLEKIL